MRHSVVSVVETNPQVTSRFSDWMFKDKSLALTLVFLLRLPVFLFYYVTSWPVLWLYREERR